MSLSRNRQTSLGSRLRTRREELGLSLEKVGVAIGLDESNARARISRYELGVHTPPLDTVIKISKVLNLPEAYLFCRDDRLAEVIRAVDQLPAADQEALLRSVNERLGQLTEPKREK